MCISLHIYLRIFFYEPLLSPTTFLWEIQTLFITLRYYGGLLHSVQPNPSGQGLTLMEEPSTIQRRYFCILMQSHHFYCLCMEVIISLLASLDSLILIIKRCIPFSLLWDLYLLLHQLCSLGNILLVIYFHIPLSYMVTHYTPCNPTSAAKVSHLWRSLQPLLGGMFIQHSFATYV